MAALVGLGVSGRATGGGRRPSCVRVRMRKSAVGDDFVKNVTKSSPKKPGEGPGNRCSRRPPALRADGWNATVIPPDLAADETVRFLRVVPGGPGGSDGRGAAPPRQSRPPKPGIERHRDPRTAASRDERGVLPARGGDARGRPSPRSPDVRFRLPAFSRLWINSLLGRMDAIAGAQLP